MYKALEKLAPAFQLIDKVTHNKNHFFLDKILCKARSPFFDFFPQGWGDIDLIRELRKTLISLGQETEHGVEPKRIRVSFTLSFMEWRILLHHLDALVYTWDRRQQRVRHARWRLWESLSIHRLPPQRVHHKLHSNYFSRRMAEKQAKIPSNCHFIARNGRGRVQAKTECRGGAISPIRHSDHYPGGTLLRHETAKGAVWLPPSACFRPSVVGLCHHRRSLCSSIRFLFLGPSSRSLGERDLLRPHRSCRNVHGRSSLLHDGFLSALSRRSHVPIGTSFGSSCVHHCILFFGAWNV